MPFSRPQISLALGFFMISETDPGGQVAGHARLQHGHVNAGAVGDDFNVGPGSTHIILQVPVARVDCAFEAIKNLAKAAVAPACTKSLRFIFEGNWHGFMAKAFADRSASKGFCLTIFNPASLSRTLILSDSIRPAPGLLKVSYGCDCGYISASMNNMIR